MRRGHVELEDDAVGIIDVADEFEYLDVLSDFSFWKPYGVDGYNKNQTDFIQFINFVMTNEGTLN